MSITYIGFSRTAGTACAVFTITGGSVSIYGGDAHNSGYASAASGAPGSPFGSIDADTFGTLVVEYCYAFGFAAGTKETDVYFALSESGGPASSAAFTSIEFVDASGHTHTLLRTDAYDPDGTDETTQRAWAWSVGSAHDVMSADGVYAVTLVV